MKRSIASATQTVIVGNHGNNANSSHGNSSSALLKRKRKKGRLVQGGLKCDWYMQLEFHEGTKTTNSDSAANSDGELWVGILMHWNLSDESQSLSVNLAVELVGESTLSQIKTSFMTSSMEMTHGAFNYGWPNFTKLKDILDSTNKYLVGDVLRIKVDVTFFRNYASEMAEVQSQALVGSTSPQSLACHWAQDMGSLLESGQDSNITLRCGSQSFKAHKLILKARSPVFQRMLESQMSETRTGAVDIDDADPCDLKAFLEHIYTSSVPPKPTSTSKDGASASASAASHLIGLMKLADKYEVLALKAYCFEQMVASVSMETAGEVAVMAHLHSAPEGIRSKAMEFCIRNWKALSNDAKFQKSVEQVPAAFLRIDG